jgi:hypothetical protein
MLPIMQCTNKIIALVFCKMGLTAEMYTKGQTYHHIGIYLTNCDICTFNA